MPEDWQSRWDAGEPFDCSIGICESETFGYGALDRNGYFAIPVPVEFANAHSDENRERHERERRAFRVLDQAFGEWRA